MGRPNTSSKIHKRKEKRPPRWQTLELEPPPSRMKLNMKLLVTGGLGFIGSNFCRHVLTKHQDYELINIDKIGVGANPASLRDLENQKTYSFIKGDICNPQLLRKTMTQVDAVVNIAAETHVDRSISDPYTFLQNNTIGTFTILEAIRKHNDRARLV